MPEIVFLGSHICQKIQFKLIICFGFLKFLVLAIQQYKDAFQENYQEWNNSFNLLFNLEELLNLKFPKQPEIIEEVSN